MFSAKVNTQHNTTPTIKTTPQYTHNSDLRNAKDFSVGRGGGSFRRCLLSEQEKDGHTQSTQTQPTNTSNKHTQGLGRTSLQNYCNFYEFCAKYMRFLRVRTTYTTIIKGRKVLETYFKNNAVASKRWSDFEA